MMSNKPRLIFPSTCFLNFISPLSVSGKMLVSAISEFFKLKIVGSIIVLTCNWCGLEQVKFTRQLSQHGLSAIFSCDPGTLNNIASHRFQGVLYFAYYNESILEKTKREYFSHWYKWLVIGKELPKKFNKMRYDADMAFIRLIIISSSLSINRCLKMKPLAKHQIDTPVYFEDVYVHPSEGASLHPWCHWRKATGLQVTHNNDRMLRRLNFKQYSLKIVSPIGHYSSDIYNGSFAEYLSESKDPQRDSAIRSAYLTSSLLFESVNASEILQATHSWSSTNNDSDSMLRRVETGAAHMTGAVLRILPKRIQILDYILPIWPFGVGFTYLAEREGSSNMYVEPFSPGVWWSCLFIAIILAIMQRITARRPVEKEGAYFGVLATWLQQDASAVPEGVSGRWSFMVMSISAMLVHAYYTSAIVSALMSSGKGGPNSLRALGDSKYAIASEDVEYMRYLFWDTKTDWGDLEYLKRKKMSSKFYVDIKKGAELVRDGNTAYHTEYNQIFPFFKTFSDDKLCKLQYVDTIPEQLAWTATTKRSQYTDMFKSRGSWLHETGLARRVVSRLRMRPPPCRTALLAERVNFGDVAALLMTTGLGALLSCIVLGIEILLAKLNQGKITVSKKRKRKGLADDTDSTVAVDDYEYPFVE